MMKITQDKLKAVLEYSPDTGDFTWIKASPRRKPGSVAGSISKKGSRVYIQIKINRKLYVAHRLAWLYMTGKTPKGVVGHDDSNGMNNRWSNLNDMTNAENGKNQSLKSNNTSGVNGVCFNKEYQKWYARIKVKSKEIFLGSFEFKEDAINARKAGNIKYGFHKNHGSKITRLATGLHH